MMDATLRNIRNKLVSGEKLSANDLRSLEPLHDAIYDEEGRVVGASHPTTQIGQDPLSTEFKLDYIDRSFLNGRHCQNHDQSSERLPRLVRYVGMVQDMLEPEYYESYDSQGRSKHFGDHYDQNEADIDNNNCKNNDSFKDSTGTNKNDNDTSQIGHYSECLAERIPLVVVPIPFASDWLLRGIQPRSSNNSGDLDGSDTIGRNLKAPKSAVVSPISASRGERKRGRNDLDVDEDSDMNVDDSPSSLNENLTSNQQTKQKTTPNGDSKIINDYGGEKGDDCLTSKLTNATDWWPVGTCGTSMDECPILAKMCYDKLFSLEVDNGRGQPLMLNDLVSFVGVLSMNPWDADFSQQQSSSISSINDIDSYGWDSMMATTNAIPPPSRLPRLHVLSYRRLDLDELARRAISVEKKNYFKSSSHNDDKLQPEGEGACDASSSLVGDSDNDSEDELSGFSTEKMSFSSDLASLLQGSPSGSLASPEGVPWIRALWIWLLSGADRRRENSNIQSQNYGEAPKLVRAGPADRALGCVSLQLSTPDVASAKSLYHKLAESILPGMCPVVAAVDLTTTVTGTSDFSFIPKKENSGRLKPCPLQLPKGSVLLVYCPPPCIDVGNDGDRNRRSKHDPENEVSYKLESIQTILHELVQHHRIRYRFEGGVMIPFEADYRVIVVTTQTQQLPCTLSALTRTCPPTPMSLTDSTTATKCSTKSELRERLVKGRSLNNKNESIFSSILLERAQRDFLERRRQSHESSASSVAPGEDDFHRWLTLTKLQTKSRFSHDEHSRKISNPILVEEEIRRGKDHLTSSQYFEPSIKDWESALQLDDDLRCTI